MLLSSPNARSITFFKTRLSLYRSYTVEPVLETTCIKQSTAFRDHCSDFFNQLN